MSTDAAYHAWTMAEQHNLLPVALEALPVAHVAPVPDTPTASPPDLDAAAEFLRLLDPTATEVTFQTFDDSEARKKAGTQRKELTKIVHGTLADRAPELADLSARGAGVFVTVNATDLAGRKASNITRVRAVFVDTDGAPLDPIMQCDPAPTFVVESSPGKFHVYWLVDGLERDEFTSIQKTIIDRFGTDANVHDLPRVLRLAGFDHQKTANTFRVKLIHQTGLPPYSADTIRQAFAPARSPEPRATSRASCVPDVPPERTTHTASATYAPPVHGVCIAPQQVTELRSALAFLPADDRDVWITMGACLQELGDVGRGLWLDWSQTSPKWQPADAQTWSTIAHDRAGYRGVFRKAQDGGWINPMSNAASVKPTATGGPSAPSYRGWRLDHVGDLLAQPVRTQWLVRGFLETTGLSCFYGMSGCGKSFVVSDIALCIATRTPWHGRPVTSGAVVYLAGEGHHGMRRRFLAWSTARGVSLDNAPLYLSSAAVDLAGEIEHVIDAVRAACETPALVVLDTLHRHLRAGADENSGIDVGPLVAAADRIGAEFGCAVLLVHHVGHAATERERGWSGLRAALDWSYSLQRSEQGPLILQCRKSKDHELPALEQFVLRSVSLPWLDEDGVPETSAVLELHGGNDSGSVVARSGSDAADDAAVLGALCAAMAAGVNVGTGRTGPGTAQAVLQTFPELSRSLHGGSGRDAFWRAINRLLATSRIRIEEYPRQKRQTSRRFVACVPPPSESEVLNGSTP